MLNLVSGEALYISGYNFYAEQHRRWYHYDLGPMLYTISTPSYKSVTVLRVALCLPYNHLYRI
jgi:hypothetical protein